MFIVMRKVINFISSTHISVVLIIAFVIAQILATFMPTEAESWRYVYSTWWFEGIMWALGINLIAVMFRFKTYRKLPVFLLHLAMIIILIGAAITRYVGYQGILHLRIGQSSSQIILTDKVNPDLVKTKNLGFTVKLDRFVIKRYPGSMQPSSYDSYVTVTDGKKSFKYHIYMNHILTYKGYRFYQASFDKDAKGSILAVSYDPGMYVTYVGYLLLIIGFVVTMLYSKSRFAMHIRRLRNIATGSLIIIVLASTCSHAFDLKSFERNSKGVANIFATILTQHNGRIQPMDTLDLAIVHKLTGKSHLLGLNYNQIIVGMITHPEVFQSLPMIRIKSPSIRKLLKIKGKYASYNDFFSKNGNFKFSQQIRETIHIPDSMRTQVQREWVKINELIYIAYMVYTYDIFKIFPSPNSAAMNYRWFSPFEIVQMVQNKQIYPAGAKLYLDAFRKLIQGLKDFDIKETREAKAQIYSIQKMYSSAILPSPSRVKWEIIYNHLNIFANLIGVYSLLGMLAILLGFFEIASKKRFVWLERAVLLAGIAALIVHTGNMALRWYIAGHAPWSDAYESIIFIAWGSAFASVVFFRKSMLSLGSGLFTAGMFMLVANLDNIDPQITNIVPVLNSYWLLIHVAFSIISYGFMSVGAMLALLNLILHLIKRFRPPEKQIQQFNSIIYLSLYIGLVLLSIGTIFGAVWANESWGAYWSWDPKETWSLISILVYAFILHDGVMYRKNNEFIFPLLAFLSFFFILMTYFGVNFYIAQGLHSYGRGSAGYFWFYVLQLGIAAWFVVVIVNFLVDLLSRYLKTPS